MTTQANFSLSKIKLELSDDLTADSDPLILTNLLILKKMEEVVVSAPKKFKSKAFVIEDLSKKEKTSLLRMASEGNTKLAALQRVSHQGIGPF